MEAAAAGPPRVAQSNRSNTPFPCITWHYTSKLAPHLLHWKQHGFNLVAYATLLSYSSALRPSRGVGHGVVAPLMNDLSPRVPHPPCRTAVRRLTALNCLSSGGERVGATVVLCGSTNESEKQGYVKCLELLPSKADIGSSSDPSRLACPMPRLQFTRAGHNLLQFI